MLLEFRDVFKLKSFRGLRSFDDRLFAFREEEDVTYFLVSCRRIGRYGF
jgi:hypothetical protein